MHMGSILFINKTRQIRWHFEENCGHAIDICTNVQIICIRIAALEALICGREASLQKVTLPFEKVQR